MTAVEAMAQSPSALTLGDRTFVILPPTPRDKFVTYARMRALAEQKATSPLDYVLKKHSHLPPAILTIAIAEAIRIGSGPPVAPPAEAIGEQFATIEGIRWRVWYHASRVLSDLKLEEIAPLVTEDNLFDVSDALDKALGLKAIDPNAPAPTTGSGS